MEELPKYIVASLVEFPEEIVIREIEGEEQNIIELRVSPKDVGKVIGKNGRIAKSLRAILTAASVKAGKNFSLEIID
ncbi:KH domain protein [Leptospira interrogans serovar Pyrogenes str. 200701872]|uniref:RNA-binding protein KhpA n=1 Tax=Leptospira interrogans serovar Pyrogenes str. 200701872 TaxID=1193029 RepID=M7A0L5_LEPIR|nr:KH domain protein [Leptospira interrogans serovar Pyrogenes str. 200701872]